MEKDDILIATSEETVEKPRRGRRKNINLDERNGAKADGENVRVARKKPAPPKPLEPESTGMIRVRGRVDADRFAIIEKHEGHPSGLLRIKGTDESDAWPTRKVMEAMHHGRLERV